MAAAGKVNSGEIIPPVPSLANIFSKGVGYKIECRDDISNFHQIFRVFFRLTLGITKKYTG